MTEPRALTANDRLKADWDSHLAWSIVLAAVVHGVAFGFWPSWALPDSSPRPAYELDTMEWITLASPSGAGEIAPALSGGTPQDTAASRVAAPEPEPGNVDGADLAALTDALLDRLGGAALRPTLAEPNYGPEPTGPAIDDEPVGAAEDDLSIGGTASSIAALESRSDADSLELERLAALEPRLSLATHSAWVLLRNPEEVALFMQRSSRREDLAEAGARGTVRVTLWIDRTGSVEWSEIIESSGDQRSDELVLELFNEVVSFRPAREEGEAVGRSFVFVIPFPWI